LINRLAFLNDLEEFAADSSRTGTRPRHGALPAVADEIRRLALGMLWHPADAEAAAQHILRAATEDCSDSGEPRRVALLRMAARHLLASEPSPFERQGWTFEALAADLTRGRDEPLPPSAFGPRSLVLVEEVKRGCWLTMLLCLDRPHRIAYLLSSLDNMDEHTGAAILEVDVADFQARAQRARELVARFTHENCGLVNRSHPCHCSRRLGRALVTGRVDPDELLFVRTRPAIVRAS
jgi:DNA-directed RNA polymerase specialized sigma24 family protein